MTAKADEPRTLVKVPVSIHAQIERRAKELNISMLDYITNLVREDSGGKKHEA